jgi:ribose transport system substrate-binding protein
MKKNTWRSMAMVAAASIAITLAGCSSGGGGSTGSGDIVIGFVPGGTTAQFWTAMKTGAEKKAKALGVTLDWQGAPDYAVAAQTPVLNSLAAKKLDALVVAPVDATAMFAPIKAIQDNGAKIVTVDSGLKDTSIVEAQVFSDNEQGGGVAAEQLVKTAGTSGTIAVLGLTPEATTVNGRITGFLDKIKELAPDAKILPTQYADGDPATQDKLQALLVAHPEITAVFVPNSSGAGAAAAIKAQGKSGISVVAYDSSTAQVALLKSGELNALVLQQPAKEGEIAVQAAYDAVKGKTPKKKTLVPNLLATTQNAGDSSISPFFY